MKKCNTLIHFFMGVRRMLENARLKANLCVMNAVAR